MSCKISVTNTKKTVVMMTVCYRSLSDNKSLQGISLFTFLKFHSVVCQDGKVHYSVGSLVFIACL